MRVAVLISCHNRKEKTKNCICTLINGNPEVKFSFYIVDDGSCDGTVEMLKQLRIKHDIRIIEGNGNLYYSGGMRTAMNVLLLETADTYEYVLLANDDVDFYPGIIERLHKESIKKNNAVIVGVTCNECGEYSYGAIKFTTGIRYHGVGVEHSNKNCDSFNANCVLISEKTFRQNGTIDPHYVHALGDFDYGLSLKRNGYNIYPSAEYVGVCNNNSNKNGWRDTFLSRKERLKKKEQPKGLPAKIWFYYLWKNFGLKEALFYSITPYIRILIGK